MLGNEYMIYIIPVQNDATLHKFHNFQQLSPPVNCVNQSVIHNFHYLNLAFHLSN